MVLQNKSDWCESRFIKEIVKVVARNLNRAILSISLHPIGIDSRVDIMAMYGMEGIGKSTLVKTAYNLNFDKFDGSNFLADVNKTLERHNGMVLKENLFEDYYVRIAGSKDRIEEEEDNDVSILEYDDDDDDEKESTLVEIEELFSDLC
ncbi:hypothetical protein FXO38_18632 [Capsicum annuum]|nr:hypothetical protein FXO38_18632 [Capsicum annuum]